MEEVEEPEDEEEYVLLFIDVAIFRYWKIPFFVRQKEFTYFWKYALKEREQVYFSCLSIS